MTSADKLREAKALIEDPERWCQGFYARTAQNRRCRENHPNAVRWCAVGAAFRVGAEETYLHRAYVSGSVSEINDHYGHAAVMEMYDRAIELAEQEPTP